MKRHDWTWKWGAVLALLLVATAAHAAEGEPPGPDVGPFEPLIGAAVAALMAGIKWLSYQMDTRIPDAVKPMIVAGLASLGTWTCNTVGVACGGNPLDWSQAVAQTLVVGFFAVTIRELVKTVYPPRGLTGTAPAPARGR